MRTYSEDLHVRVVEFLKKGHTHWEAAEVSGISMRSIIIWKKWIKKGKGWYLSSFRIVRIALTMKNCWPKKFIEFAKKRDKTRLVFVDESGIDRCLH